MTWRPAYEPIGRSRAMTTLDPMDLHVLAGGADAVAYFGMTAEWLVTAEATGGSFAQFLQVAPPGTGVPLHVHHSEHESIVMLAGALVARLGDATLTLRAGDALALPKGIVHGWRAADGEPARFIGTVALAAGGDWPAMFRTLAEIDPGDVEAIKAVIAPNDIELVEPVVLP